MAVELKDVKMLTAKERDRAMVLRFSVKKTEENVAALKEAVAKEKAVVTLTIA